MLYSGSLLSGAFSGLIAAGILNGLDNAKGLRAWSVFLGVKNSEKFVPNIHAGAGSSSSRA